MPIRSSTSADRLVRSRLPETAPQASPPSIRRAGTTEVTISSIGGVSVSINGFLNLAATSSGTATDIGGIIEQNFNGTFAITQNANGTGINYLSGSFSGLTFGFSTGSVATLAASDSPSTVSFSSSYSPSLPLGTPRGASFTFSNVSPALGIVGTGSDGTIGRFTAQGSGTFSAVPEPSSFTLAGIGFLGLTALFYVDAKPRTVEAKLAFSRAVRST